MKTVEKSMLDRILYIGNEIPESLMTDKRDKFILLGCPQDIINEVGGNLKDKSEHEIACFIAEYAYKKANPNGKFSEPPSMLYEMVAKDFSDFLSQSNQSNQ